MQLLGSVLSERCKFVGRSTRQERVHQLLKASKPMTESAGLMCRGAVPKSSGTDLVVTADMFAPHLLRSRAVNFAGAMCDDMFIFLRVSSCFVHYSGDQNPVSQAT